jgi:hypothetical protein
MNGWKLTLSFSFLSTIKICCSCVFIAFSLPFPIFIYSLAYSLSYKYAQLYVVFTSVRL